MNPDRVRYRVNGYAHKWFVVARNERIVATCSSRVTAKKIAKLLDEDAFQRELRAMRRRQRNCGPDNPCERPLCQRCNPQGIHA